MSEYLNRVQQITQDDEQRAAFYSEGSQVVIAGPGSGKTYLLTAKVAKLLLEGTVRYPQKIACITFSRPLAEKLVKELRELGVYDAERVYVGTIHAFCIAEILMPAVNLLPSGSIPDPFRIASDEEKKNALSAALKAQKKILPAEDWDQENILRDLDKFRRRYFLSKEDTFSGTTLPEASDSSKKYLQNLDWAKLAEDYHQNLQQASLASMDFVQVEMLALCILKTKPSLVATLSAAYPWWFVDEYQDLSPLFHQMVTHLVGQKCISVFAIGDPNQCIYEELQGSRPENLDELAKMVERVEQNKSIRLLKNYRSPQNIIDIGDCVLGKCNGYQSNIKQLAHCEVIKLRKSHDDVLEKVKSLIVTDSTTSVMTFSRGESRFKKISRGKSRFEKILDGLEREKYDVQTDKDPDFSSNTELLEWLQKLAQWCAGQAVYFYELTPFWHGFCQPNGADDEAEDLQRERELFHSAWQLRKDDVPLVAWLKEIHQTVLTDAHLTEYEKFRPDDVGEFRKLLAAASKVERLKNKTVRSFGRTDAKILLTTFYSSKGLQFDTTIVINLDGISSKSTPNLRKRLAYVAVSRAKTRLYILVTNQGKFAQKIEQATIGQMTFWDCDSTDKITQRNG